MDYKDLISLDFETYYSADYSLSLQSYNTSEYIRDEQFLIHGCGFQLHGDKPYYVAGHDESLKECQRLNLHDRPVLAHNMAFDGFILHEHAGIHPLRYVDTLSMARACMGHHMRHHLGAVAKYFGFEGKTEGLIQTKGKRVLTPLESKILGAYCMNDVEQTAMSFWKLLEFIPPDEMELIDLTLRMFCEPRLLIDIPLVQAERQKEIDNKAHAVKKAETEHAALMSNDKFAQLLRELGVDPPTKISPTTEKSTYAFAKTDLGFQALLAHADEAVQYVAQARVAVKSTLNETRAERLEKAGANGQPLPVLLNYAGAHTYRWSGGNKLNLQNLPRGGTLRRAILAPPDHILLVADLAQIEARLNVWLCNQTDIVNAFSLGEDVYKVMAGKIYGKPLADITKNERFIGKICVLGLGFGMGWKKLKATLAVGFAGPPVEISEQEARRIVNIYRSANPKIVAMWDFLSQRLLNMAGNPALEARLGPVTFLYKMIELPSGLALKYPGLQAEEGEYGSMECTYLNRFGRSKIYGGLLLENIIQALARCVIGEQMLSLKRYGNLMAAQRDSWTIATTTHDEIVMIVPEAEIERALTITKQVMSTPPLWAPTLPLAVDIGYDRCYSK